MLKPRRYKRVVSAGTPAPSGDPYWTSVSLLTNFENNLTFQDGSTNNFAITRTGVVNPSLNTPFSGVGGSEYFNGSTGYLTIPRNTAFDISTGDFTIECWFNTAIANSNFQRIFSIDNTSGSNTASTVTIAFEIGSTGIVIAAYSGATGYGATTATALSTNTWYHLALVRNGSTFTGYINGTSAGSSTFAGTLNYAALAAPSIGAWNNSGWSRFINGFVSNVRIVKGTAVYTSAFTPPTAPLSAITNTSLLITGTGQGMFNNSTFVDQGPNALTVTATGAPVYSGLSPFGNTYAGSVLLNGTSQYLSAPSNAAFDLGSSSFTVEAWVNPSAFNAYGYAVASRYAFSGSASGWLFRISATILQFVRGNDIILAGTISASVGTWYHVAAVRNGSTLTLYLNGTQVAQATSIANFTDAATTLQIGSTHTIPDYANGYTSNFRIVKGTAVYTANFTPSTTPLTAITNTSLLVRGDTGAFYDLSNVGNPETGVNSPAVTTQITKFGAGSISLGSGKELTVPYSSAFNFYNTSATIECWIYATANGGGGLGTIIADWKTGSSPGPSSFLLYYGTGTVAAQVVQKANTYSDQGNIVLSGTAALNTWHFIALTYDGTTLRLFINGTLAQSSTSFTGFNQSHNTVIDVGNLSNFGTTYCFNGYLDDIRITKGVARYTANFTPPTATFPTA